jgi:hypothetical protein
MDENLALSLESSLYATIPLRVEETEDDRSDPSPWDLTTDLLAGAEYERLGSLLLDRKESTPLLLLLAWRYDISEGVEIIVDPTERKVIEHRMCAYQPGLSGDEKERALEIAHSYARAHHIDHYPATASGVVLWTRPQDDDDLPLSRYAFVRLDGFVRPGERQGRIAALFLIVDLNARKVVRTHRVEENGGG